MDFQCTIGIIILAIAKAKRRTTKSTGTKNYESLGILSAAKIDKCFVCKKSQRFRYFKQNRILSKV